MAGPQTLLPALLGIAARRTLFLWLMLRAMAGALLRFGARTDAEFQAIFWSPVAHLWVLLLGALLLLVMEATRWREAALLGNLGLPRYTLVAMAGGMLILLEVALRAVRP